MAEDTIEVREEETSSRRMDPELRAIAAIIRIVEEHDEPARSRIMAYVGDRYAR